MRTFGENDPCLPCPFCGQWKSVDLIEYPRVYDGAEPRIQISVGCTTCCVTGPARIGQNHALVLTRAIRAWNERAE